MHWHFIEKTIHQENNQQINHSWKRHSLQPYWFERGNKPNQHKFSKNLRLFPHGPLVVGSVCVLSSGPPQKNCADRTSQCGTCASLPHTLTDVLENNNKTQSVSRTRGCGSRPSQCGQIINQQERHFLQNPLMPLWYVVALQHTVYYLIITYYIILMQQRHFHNICICFVWMCLSDLRRPVLLRCSAVTQVPLCTRLAVSRWTGSCWATVLKWVRHLVITLINPSHTA